MRLVVGMTGAAIGIRLLEVLGALGVETHLVLSRWARATIEMETGSSVRQVQALAGRFYGHGGRGRPRMPASSTSKIAAEDQSSVYSLLANAAARAPQATAITFLPSMESEPIRLTHGAFLARLHRMARLFRGLGVARGDVDPAGAQYSRCRGRALGR
jgi:hypothetical protein